MGNHLTDLGFLAADEQEVTALVHEAADAGNTVATPDGHYICWSPGAGVELWVHLGPDAEILGYMPHFAGAGTIRVQVLDLLRSASSSLGGSLYAFANPAARHATFEGPAVMIDVPDLGLLRHRPLPLIAAVQVAAFAHAAECFATEQAFVTAQENKPYRVSLDYFVPGGTFARPARAEAAFAGRIERAGLRTNPATGQRFYHMGVRTRIGPLDVVADPAVVDGAPEPGGIMHGHFWLSGRIVAVG